MRKTTFGNKIIAVALLLASFIVTLIEKEATGFILVCCISLPLFFAKRNYIIWNGVAMAALFFLREIYKLYYEETVSSIGRASDLRSVRVLSVRVRHCLFFIFFLKGSINHAN